MSGTVTKLFRDPEIAHRVIKRLKEESLNKGLSIIVRDEGKGISMVREMKHLRLKIDGGHFIAGGEVIQELQTAGEKAEIREVLKSGLGLSEEGCDYYISAIGSGGILVSMKAEGEEANKIHKLFREEEESMTKDMEAKSTTFCQASRMAATNAMDAAMSGDFRKY